MKHDHLPDAMWSRPWEWDPPNPRVPECDEYLKRKFKDGDESSDDSDDDDDEGDNTPDLVPIEEDLNVQRAQMDYAVRSIQRDVEDGGDDDDEEIPTHMIKTPNGRVISKVTAVCML